MTSRLEAYLYASGTLYDQEGTATLVVTEPGPAVFATSLSGPMRLADALTHWQPALNASALAGTYTLAWDASAQAVSISATGVASFEVEFLGDLAAALGFSAPSGHTGALAYTGDQQATARFDDLRMTATLTPHEDATQLQEWRHGRYRAIAWTRADVLACRLWVQRSRMASLLGSYCAAGLVRVYPDEAVSAPHAADELGGYVEGYVIALEVVEDASHRSAWAECRLALAVARAS